VTKISPSSNDARPPDAAIPAFPDDGAAAPESLREDDAKQRLIAAAGPVFAEHGFDRATIRDICRVAGVNIASVGYHFGDKFGLYREVIRNIRSRCKPGELAARPEGMSPRDELHLSVRMMLTQMMSGDQTGWEAQLMMREMNHPTAVFAEMVEESFRPHFERMKSIISQLTPPETPIDVIEKITLSIVGQCLYYRVGSEVVKQLIPEQRRAECFGVEPLARHITGVILAAAEHALAMRHAESLSPVQFPDFFREATS
jgi:TetR/AcrR family transcriptional regulator, regulator of cefoperazone and chloramphenicol sensitivity